MNTTDNIKSLFNSANPMTTENSYEPSGVCIGDTVLDNTPSGFALFQAIGGHYTSPAQAIEELVDNAISAIKANGGSGKVSLPHGWRRLRRHLRLRQRHRHLGPRRGADHLRLRRGADAAE